MEKIDKFLAEIEDQCEKKKELNAPKSRDKIDEFLGDFMSNFQENKTEKKSNSNDLFEDIKQNFTQRKSQENKQNEDLFEDIKSNFTQRKPSTSKEKCQGQNRNLDAVFADVQAKFVEQKKDKQTTRLSDSNLTEIQANFQQKKAQTEVNKPSNIEAIKEEELNKQRRRKALVKQAEMWLKKLDPYSDEGFWFQQFADSYDSKLEAAIDYLSVLNEKKS